MLQNVSAAVAAVLEEAMGHPLVDPPSVHPCLGKPEEAAPQPEEAAALLQESRPTNRCEGKTLRPLPTLTAPPTSSAEFPVRTLSFFFSFFFFLVYERLKVKTEDLHRELS